MVLRRKNGFFGFQNPSSGRFLGHDGEEGVRSGVGAWAFHLKEWEFWTPRQHPEGGYQVLWLLPPDELMVLCVEEDGKQLVRRTHGSQLWEFFRVNA